MRPTRRDFIGAGLLFLILATLVVVIVLGHPSRRASRPSLSEPSA